MKYKPVVRFKSLGITPNENKKACSSCPRKCCEHFPGSMIPEQLQEITVDEIVKLLKNGYCIDWWEGDPRWKYNDPKKPDTALNVTYYLRPRIVGREDKLKDPAWAIGKSVCAFLSPTGCIHKFENRPVKCQDLKPNAFEPGSCVGHLKKYRTKADIVTFWIPYQDLVLEAINIIENGKQPSKTAQALQRV